MGIEVVHHEDHLLAVGVSCIEQAFDEASPVPAGPLPLPSFFVFRLTEISGGGEQSLADQFGGLGAMALGKGWHDRVGRRRDEERSCGRGPPSGKFGAIAAWYWINLLTYNLLTVLRRHALPERFQNARPKKLRYEVFTIAAEISSHARQLTAQLGAPPLAADELIAARGRLRDLQATIRALGKASGP